MPTYPKRGKFISGTQDERQRRRRGTPHLSREEAGTDGRNDHGAPGEERPGINWTKVAAFFVIFLLVGSLVAFFVLYALSLL